MARYVEQMALVLRTPDPVVVRKIQTVLRGKLAKTASVHWMADPRHAKHHLNALTSKLAQTASALLAPVSLLAPQIVTAPTGKSVNREHALPAPNFRPVRATRNAGLERFANLESVLMVRLAAPRIRTAQKDTNALLEAALSTSSLRSAQKTGTAVLARSVQAAVARLVSLRFNAPRTPIAVQAGHALEGSASLT